FGLAMGAGKRGPRDGSTLVEGVFTAPILIEMARQRGIEMPIANAVAAVLDDRSSVDDAIESLLTRPLRAEI
ncbi:MAG TPA: glycerol-3-phosphate dehydrogenase, partial [Xanthobacteraceae bacterium]|nr:glycerol-3-phosphate dehydrogenase [Xanthobacteraceae bacterium]